MKSRKLRTDRCLRKFLLSLVAVLFCSLVVMTIEYAGSVGEQDLHDSAAGVPDDFRFQPDQV
eukprot:3961428-Amphidinium_carterae.2